MKPRIYRKRLQRDFRKGTVNYPKRVRVTLEEPTRFGKKTTTFTAITEREETNQPNKRNENWETTLSYGRIKIRHAKLEDRYFLFYENKCLEEISRAEQYELFRRGLESIDAFKEKINGVHDGKRYITFELKNARSWKNEN